MKILLQISDSIYSCNIKIVLNKFASYNNVTNLKSFTKTTTDTSIDNIIWRKFINNVLSTNSCIYFPYSSSNNNYVLTTKCPFAKLHRRIL